MGKVRKRKSEKWKKDIKRKEQAIKRAEKR
jgi:hypothetical protein